MLFRVHDDVDKSVPHLARRRERPGVEAIVPNPPRTTEHAIDCAREANRHSHEPAGKRALVVGLHEQMQMVLLHRKMHDTKPRPSRTTQRLTDLMEYELPAKARQ